MQRSVSQPELAHQDTTAPWVVGIFYSGGLKEEEKTARALLPFIYNRRLVPHEPSIGITVMEAGSSPAMTKPRE